MLRIFTSSKTPSTSGNEEKYYVKSKNFSPKCESQIFKWKDNIRIDLEEIGINGGNWVDSAQDRNYWRALVNAALNL